MRFCISGCWGLGALSQFAPVLGTLRADGRWNHLPSAHLPGVLGVAVLVFPEGGSQGQPPTTSSGQMGSGSQELPKLHPVGAGPLPLAFLCPGCTLPTVCPRYAPHGWAEFSTEWKPLPHPSPSTRPSAPAGSQLGENNIFPNLICM